MREAYNFQMDFPSALRSLGRLNTKLYPLPFCSEDVSPFLKWVGGKRSVIGELKERLPDKFGTYYEPFVGGGALFFEIQPKRAVISDTNLELIITYKEVQQNVEVLIERLKEHQAKHSEKYYYKVRAQHNLKTSIDIASRLIYLNRTCFNGLWRVNQKGEFNVPMGRYSNPAICQEEKLKLCSLALKDVTIQCVDYASVSPKPGDFCYFDPPYHPTCDTSFTAYSSLGFNEKDQKDLAEFCKKLHQKGVRIMLSNSNTPFIREIYSDECFKIDIINSPRFVNCKPSGRSAVEEVLITNY